MYNFLILLRLYINFVLCNTINMLCFIFFQQVDTTLLGLSEHEALKNPYIASMGVYVFRTDVLLKLLRWKYPSCNDFGSEIIPSAVAEHNVQVWLSVCNFLVSLISVLILLNKVVSVLLNKV